MTQADLFDATPREQARRLRDAGMQTAVDHADAVEPSWGQRAYATLMAMLDQVPSGTPITCELVRMQAENAGFPPPPDGRAWGAVMMRAAKAGRIRKDGYTVALDPKVHCNPITQWAKP